MNTMTPRQTQQEAYDIDVKRSEAWRLENLQKGLEKQGLGWFMRRFTSRPITSAFAAFNSTASSLALVAVQELNTSLSSSALKQISTFFTKPAQTETNETDGLTEAFDGAGLGDEYISSNVSQELKALETRFETKLNKLGRTTVPNLRGDVHEVFAKQQQDMHLEADKFGLRVLFDKNTREVHYAYDSAKVDQLKSAFEGKTSHLDGSQPSIRVTVFTASASPSNSLAPVSRKLDEQQRPVAPQLNYAA